MLKEIWKLARLSWHKMVKVLNAGLWRIYFNPYFGMLEMVLYFYYLH